MRRRAYGMGLVGIALFCISAVRLYSKNFDRFFGVNITDATQRENDKRPTTTRTNANNHNTNNDYNNNGAQQSQHKQQRIKQQKVAPLPKYVPEWVSMLPSCSIVYHIKIPKTASTSVMKALWTSPDYVHITRSNTYSRRGRNFRKSFQAVLKRVHNSSGPVWLSVEVGIDDLMKQDYRLWNKTCFFTVVREPHEWVLSANNHIKKTSSHKTPMRSLVGFLSTSNIQSKMVGRALSTEDRRKMGLKLCVFSLDQVGRAIRHLPGSSDVGRHNVKPHDAREPDVNQFVLQRYKQDLELWSEVQGNGGVLCSSS